MIVIDDIVIDDLEKAQCQGVDGAPSPRQGDRRCPNKFNIFEAHPGRAMDVAA